MTATRALGTSRSRGYRCRKLHPPELPHQILERELAPSPEQRSHRPKTVQRRVHTLRPYPLNTLRLKASLPDGLLGRHNIEPALKKKKIVTIDFEGIDGATQSFVHAMISHPIRASKGKALDMMRFKNSSAPVHEIIAIVCDYRQDTAE